MIRDVYPGFRIPDSDFFPIRIADPGVKITGYVPDPGSGSVYCFWVGAEELIS